MLWMLLNWCIFFVSLVVVELWKVRVDYEFFCIRDKNKIFFLLLVDLYIRIKLYEIIGKEI